MYPVKYIHREKRHLAQFKGNVKDNTKTGKRTSNCLKITYMLRLFSIPLKRTQSRANPLRQSMTSYLE